MQVVVFNDGDRSLGMVVDQILDVAEEAVTVRQKSAAKVCWARRWWASESPISWISTMSFRPPRRIGFRARAEPPAARRILVAEASAFSRGLIRSSLDMAGYQVVEAANLDEAIRGLEQQPVDVVVAALDLPPGGSSALLAAMRRRPEWDGIPVLALADRPNRSGAQACRRSSGWPVSGLPDEVRPGGHARIGGAAGLGAGSGRGGARPWRGEREDNHGEPIPRS